MGAPGRPRVNEMPPPGVVCGMSALSQRAVSPGPAAGSGWMDKTESLSRRSIHDSVLLPITGTVPPVDAPRARRHMFNRMPFSRVRVGMESRYVSGRASWRGMPVCAPRICVPTLHI